MVQWWRYWRVTTIDKTIETQKVFRWLDKLSTKIVEMKGLLTNNGSDVDGTKCIDAIALEIKAIILSKEKCFHLTFNECYLIIFSWKVIYVNVYNSFLNNIHLQCSSVFGKINDTLVKYLTNWWAKKKIGDASSNRKSIENRKTGEEAKRVFFDKSPPLV
jgi:hypothetical protein